MRVLRHVLALVQLVLPAQISTRHRFLRDLIGTTFRELQEASYLGQGLAVPIPLERRSP